MKVIKVTHSEDTAEHAKENVLSFIENRLKERPETQRNKITKLIFEVAKLNVLTNLGAAGAELIMEEHEALKYYRKLMDDIMEYVYSIDNISLRQAFLKYPRTKNLAIGTYTLHPCDDKALCLLENFHGKLAMDKDSELIALLGKMGAKNVHIQIIENGSTKLNTGIKGESKGVEGSMYANSEKQALSDRDLTINYEGNKTEIPATLLEDSLWYKTDSELNGIFEGRRYLQNQIKKYRYINTYTESFDFDFNLAAKYLNVASADIKAQYNEVKMKKRIFDIEFA